MSNLYYVCADCRKSCNTVERDFGIGAYEFWGATGCHSNVQVVSECCEADFWTLKEYEEILAEETPDE